MTETLAEKKCTPCFMRTGGPDMLRMMNAPANSRDELMTHSESSRGRASLLASTLQKLEDDHAIQSGVQSY
jgi:hypothetical protein